MVDAIATAARKAAEWTAERDRLIREAITAGESLRGVAGRTGTLTHSAVAKIARR